jgi:hypothetical protein
MDLWMQIESTFFLDLVNQQESNKHDQALMYIQNFPYIFIEDEEMYSKLFPKKRRNGKKI